jgi:hypothetical protein
MMDEEEYQKMQDKRAARKLQRETGVKYTEALRTVQADKANKENN